jgi:endonuclease G
LLLAVAFSVMSVWFVHHPRKWVERRCASIPSFLSASILSVGSAVGDVTDGFGWTGHDAIYEYDVEAPEGSVLFAGAPRRTDAPAPMDIVPLDRGEFIVGWSPKLRHPVWCAYHVAKEQRHEPGIRPDFSRDRNVPSAPPPSAYKGSGYDRGHMAPNFAIKTRYGDDDQKQTFLMSNIAPQSPALNRGVWRDVEHRIAQLWTARYGEIWVVVGCISSPESNETLNGSDIDVPQQFYQVIVAQEGMDVRALAVLFPQNVKYGEYAARYIVSIDELEQLTGLDFLPELPEFIQNPLESELPSRLWPIRWQDMLDQLAIRFAND